MNLNKKIIFLTICTFLAYSFTLAQPGSKNFEEQNLDQVFSNSGMSAIAYQFYDNGWIRFREDMDLDPNLIFENYKSLFGLSKYDEMVLEKVIEDKSGFNHYRFQQYHNGIPVEGMKYTIHATQNQAYSGSGSILVGLQTSLITPQSTMKLSNIEIELKKKGYAIKKSGQQIISKLDEAAVNSSNYSITYKFDFSGADGTLKWVYIDPNQNMITKTVSSAAHYSYPTKNGTCQTLYNGTRNFKTYHKSNSTCTNYYYMGHFKYNGVSHGVGLINYFTQGESPLFCSPRPKSKFRDGDNNWGEDDEIKMATSAYWALQKAFDYFDEKHQLYNFDQGSSKYIVLAAYDFPTPNLQFSIIEDGNYNIEGTRIRFSKAIADVSGAMVSPDVIGHEYAHGVLRFLNLDLNHTGETGAIEEGICDIFGSLIENHAVGFSNDIYILAEDPIISTSPNIYKRSLMNPKSMGLHSINANCDMATGMPDTYYGDNWELRQCNGNANYTNSSILGYWYYLLSNGGSGVNDNGLAYNVSGIGLETTAEILYEFMTAYLAPASSYTDVRNATIEIAHNNYEACSDEYVQTVKAWDAVGVPSDGPYSYEDEIVSCQEVSFMHQQGLPYYNSAVNSIEINCTIGNGYHTTIESGGTIKLNPGFSCGTGGSLKLDIVPCD